MKRPDGRKAHQLRPVAITQDIFENAPGSVLFSLGRTKVLCAVTMTQGVPPFMRGQGKGWLTAEYAMLPASTVDRTPREMSSLKRNGRNVEISRIIGRALRSIVDMEKFGEYTITIDCDVLQADGSTRCAAICGAQAALNLAIKHWLDVQVIQKSIIKTQIAAVSAGVFEGEPLLDLCAFEDNNIQSDFNFIMTEDGHLVEVQGTAETAVVTWEQFVQLHDLARKGAAQLCEYIKKQTA